MSQTLLGKVIRLAHANPDLRPHLLPLIKKEAGTGRDISAIAAEIYNLWKPVHPTAKPYLEAMKDLKDLSSTYGAESAEAIVGRFLANASGFRGPDAKRIKDELKKILK